MQMDMTVVGLLMYTHQLVRETSPLTPYELVHCKRLMRLLKARIAQSRNSSEGFIEEETEEDVKLECDVPTPLTMSSASSTESLTGVTYGDSFLCGACSTRRALCQGQYVRCVECARPICLECYLMAQMLRKGQPVRCCQPQDR